MLEIVKDFLSRHRNNINRVMHIIGIPLAFCGIFKLCIAEWIAGIICLFAGYLLQFIGHYFFEKSQLGEVLLIKAIAGKLKRD